MLTNRNSEITILTDRNGPKDYLLIRCRPFASDKPPRRCRSIKRRRRCWHLLFGSSLSVSSLLFVCGRVSFVMFFFLSSPSCLLIRKHHTCRIHTGQLTFRESFFKSRVLLCFPTVERCESVRYLKLQTDR